MITILIFLKRVRVTNQKVVNLPTNTQMDLIIRGNQEENITDARPHLSYVSKRFYLGASNRRRCCGAPCHRNIKGNEAGKWLLVFVHTHHLLFGVVLLTSSFFSFSSLPFLPVSHFS
jgi:hypothetical protein